MEIDAAATPTSYMTPQNPSSSTTTTTTTTSHSSYNQNSLEMVGKDVLLVIASLCMLAELIQFAKTAQYFYNILKHIIIRIKQKKDWFIFSIGLKKEFKNEIHIFKLHGSNDRNSTIQQISRNARNPRFVYLFNLIVLFYYNLFYLII